MKYPKSDHFDGKLFFNPSRRGFKKFSDVYKFSREKGEGWPKWIQNRGTPQVVARNSADEMRATFVNHATFLLQVGGLNVLTDPLWSRRCSPVKFAGPKRHREPGLQLSQLPVIDVVLVSHNHYDHLDIATLVKLNIKFNPLFIVPLANAAILLNAGIERVHELDWWETFEFLGATGGEAKITLTPAQHWSARGLFDRFKMLWGGFMFASAGEKIFFAGDTGYGGHFKEIRGRLGSPTLALLPIGAYEPRWFMKDNHMNPDEAGQAHLDLQASTSIAMHFGTFQLSHEAIDAPVSALKAAREKLNIAPDTFRILEFGETLILKSRNI
jgi:L-ascorbate metabolism protein UlaG (beta-lactamase superfamily)